MGHILRQYLNGEQSRDAKCIQTESGLSRPQNISLYLDKKTREILLNFLKNPMVMIAKFTVNRDFTELCPTSSGDRSIETRGSRWSQSWKCLITNFLNRPGPTKINEAKLNKQN